MILFETERLIIAETQKEDAAFYHEMVNSPGWLTHIGDRGIRTVEDAANFIENKVRPAYAEFGFGFYKIILKSNGNPIGTVGLIKRPTLEHVDIGYALLPEYEGKGYTSEAATRMLDHAINTLSINPVLGITTPTNFASHRILEKIGLRKVDTMEWMDGSTAWVYSTAVKET